MAWLGKFFTAVALIVGGIFGGHTMGQSPQLPTNTAHAPQTSTQTKLPSTNVSISTSPHSRQYIPPASDTNMHAGEQVYSQMIDYGSAGGGMHEQPQGLGWQQTAGDGWAPIGTPPACPSPLTLQSPVDLTKVTSVLYPGQYRGGQYKAHGGFRFDTDSTNTMSVTIPLDAKLFAGSRYLEGGEVQYLLLFINPCGIMYRFDHIHDLVPAVAQQLDAQLPEPKVNDSRTTSINPPISFSGGDQVAMVIGFVGTHNVTLDFGAYDMRNPNTASQDTSWSAIHSDFFAQHALCWFDLLGGQNAALLRSLPGADAQNGKTSDFCK